MKQFIYTICFLLVSFSGFSNNSVATTEKLVTNWEKPFYLLIFLGIFLLFVIYTLAGSIKSLLKSDYYRGKLIEKEEKRRKNSAIKTILLVAFIPSLAHAQGSSYPIPEAIPQSWFWMVLLIDIILLGVVLYLRKLFYQLMAEVREQKQKSTQEAPVLSTAKINKLLTDAVPIEDENDILLDHEYDGIQELDNNLPPWWKWGFYVSIFIGVLYLFNYHIFKISDLQVEAYHKDVEAAELAIKEYRKKMALNVDETSVTYLSDESALAKGKKTFELNCAVCHGKAGEGAVGPNLTDPYWLYGGDIKDVFKTVKNGAKNGMKSWKDDLTPVQIQEVSSFILSIQGSNPANAKEPQGNLYVATDTTATN